MRIIITLNRNYIIVMKINAYNAINKKKFNFFSRKNIISYFPFNLRIKLLVSWRF